MFIKENFVNDGPYLRYRTEEAPYGKIVGRWKNGRGFITKAIFKNWLIKRSGLSPKVYFEAFDKGHAPLDIMRHLDRKFFDAKRAAWNKKIYDQGYQQWRNSNG